MAIRLSAWLEETIESLLLLGNQWPQDSFESKRCPVGTQSGRQWDVYHDNGSSLDIINHVHHDRNSALQILKVSPLTLTDGHNQIISHFTPQIHHPPHLIGVLLEQLRHIRELQDSRCLLSGPDEAEVEAVDEYTAGAMGSDGNMPDGNDTHTQMMGTQLPLATQLPLPSRPRAGDDEPQVIGVTRLQPVLAGNTRRSEIRPGAAVTDHETHTKLLTLLELVKNPSANKNSTTSVPGFVQSALGKPQSGTAPTADERPEVPSDPSNRQQTQSETKIENSKTTSSMRNNKKNKVNKVRDISPEPTTAAEDIQVEEQDIQQSLIEDSNDTVPECSWMKGLIFNSNTLTVPKTQKDLLGKDISWLKPQPGVTPFPDGNMPHTILVGCHRIADERAGSDIEEDSDLDPSPESVDPSPESLIQKTQDEPATTQDDDDTNSQTSWPTSPEQPEPPRRAHQELPPDSSIEKPASHSEHDSASQSIPTSKQPRDPPVIDISDDEESTGPSSSPPVPAAPADSDDEMEMEESLPQALGEDLAQHTQPPPASDKLPKTLPAQSPVVIQVKETPYGKGKNVIDAISSRASNTAQSSSGEPKHTSSTSMVQSTYGTPSLSDLADLVIFNDPKDDPSGVQEKVPGAELKEVAAPSSVARNLKGDGSGDVEMPDHVPDTHNTKEEPGCETTAAQQLQHDLSNGTNPAPASHTTPKPAQLPPRNEDLEPSPAVPLLASQSTKRKSTGSPTKSKRRQSKRREIKFVGFKSDASSVVDPVAAMRKDREESYRKFHEQRNSSTSFDSRPEPTSRISAEQDSDAMEVDKVVKREKREPPPIIPSQNQDLYDEPSPRKAKPAASPASRPPVASPRPKDLSRNTQTRGPVPIPAQVPPASSKSVDQDGDLTVFQAFKAAYPKYDGDEKHFRNQCLQMYQLEQEDKMVPKWQWDDFIIRNRADYMQHVVECAGQGENPEPYHRFYKDYIRDTLYKEGIIQNTKTLQTALEELGATPARPEKPKSIVRPTQKPKSARTSLPGAFDQPKKPTHDRIKGAQSRPRHSLPTNAQLQAQSSLRPTSSSSASSSRPHPRLSKPTKGTSPASRPTHRPSINSTTDAAEAAEAANAAPGTVNKPHDKYRDFVFGLERMASLTGITKVDPKKPWPQNLAGRPSIADAPRRNKVDVLDWGDVLGKMGWRGGGE